MEMFGALDNSTSGITADQTWLTAISDNIANANDTAPLSSTVFPVEQVMVGAAPANPNDPNALPAGVVVRGVVGVDPQGRIEYDPQNPQANAQGLVRGTAVNLGDQMVDMVQAQSSYESNVSAFQQAKEAYTATLKMGD